MPRHVQDLGNMRLKRHIQDRILHTYISASGLQVQLIRSQNKDMAADCSLFLNILIPDVKMNNHEEKLNMQST
jgi:hypothetical protein